MVLILGIIIFVWYAGAFEKVTIIDQQDGQCLKQFEIFKNYIKKSFQTSTGINNETEEKIFYSIINDMINEISNSTLGPVHINVPIREQCWCI